ncbi:hypothetical protein PR202_gb18739 [Eleusine coracana subsp. coracana]|uniref:Cystatin domain-containing protein n=1 Tax=Eleusine coracana subsp. coracana TaxID=191504 RepID=A0AAV5F6E6_ELECO|nr:hypothetical protein QOZ80_3BG0292540 [Eleusine coracana subsp. coracana]GJN30431.1 hypothetical protein PR202_gb18739 [Eleusine coracana subsp. coracana]
MMMMRSLLLLLPLLVAAVVLFPAGTTEATWTTVTNPRDLVITQVGRFCVLVYNLPHGTSFQFVRVVRGETERLPSGGTNYRLQLEVAATRGARPKPYECLVWGVPGSRANTWKLQSFKPIAA